MRSLLNIDQTNEPASRQTKTRSTSAPANLELDAAHPSSCDVVEASGAPEDSVEAPSTGTWITVIPSIVPSLVSKRYTLCLRTKTHVWRKIYASPEAVVPDVEGLSLVGEHRFEDPAVPLWLAIRRTFRDAIQVSTSDLNTRSFSRSSRSKRFREG